MRARLLLTVLAAFMLGFSLLSPVAHAEPQAPQRNEDGTLALDVGEPYVMRKGHTDALHLDLDPSDRSKVILNAKEDESGVGVRRTPEEVIFAVADGAYTQATANYAPVGVAGYYLPQTQDYSLLWPGWDSMAISSLNPSQVRFVFDNVAGPGDVLLWIQGAFGDLRYPLGGADQSTPDMKLDSGDTIVQTYPAHVHTNWLFSQPGIYKFTVHGEVDTAAGTQTTNTAVYTFAVGEDAINEAVVQWKAPKQAELRAQIRQDAVFTDAGAVKAHVDANKLDVPTIAATQGETVELSFTALDPNGSADVYFYSSPTHLGTTTPDAAGNATVTYTVPAEAEVGTHYAVAVDHQANYGIVEVNVSEPAPEPDPADDQIPGDTQPPAGSDTRADGDAPVGGEAPAGDQPPADDRIPNNHSAGSESPDIQSHGKQSSGSQPPSTRGTSRSSASGPANTPQPGVLNPVTLTPVTTEMEQCIPTPIVEKVEKTRTEGGSAAGTKVGGSYKIPANTHVHQNWVFTAPGTYDLTLRQSATLKSGETVSAQDTIRFIVGGQGNANSGHFDIGTTSDGASISMLVKDDRKQPASWVAPSSLTFGLGDAAKTTAPKGIEFIADEGQDIWMISATQAPNVPWVGANTQHPDLLKHTTGEVTWTLVGATGPGSVAVFGSGHFGAIGDVWFGGRTPATEGETITEMVDQEVWVGRTASGEACELTVEQKNQLCADGKVAKGYTCPAGTVGAAAGGAGALSHTGAASAGLAGVATALILAGACMVRRERAQR